MNELILSLTCFLFYVVIKYTDSRPNLVKYYIAICTIYSYILVVTVTLNFVLIWKGRNCSNASLVMKCLRPITKVFNMSWELQNPEIFNAKGSAVILSNHQHALDLLGFIHAWPSNRKIANIAKKQMMYFGPLGLMCYLMGTIFIDRENPKKAYQVLDSVAETMKKEELKVWMFPEGTRNVEKKVNVLPFKRGAFALAVAAQVPIVPLVFSPYYFFDSKNCTAFNGGHIILRCLEPVPTAGLTIDDIPDLQERLHNIIQNAYDELCNEVHCKYSTSLNYIQGSIKLNN